VASEASLSARETEQAAFASIIRSLEDADTHQKRVRSLGRNHDLWSTLLKDLALQGNQLPTPLKDELIGLGAWSMRYSTLALLKDLPLQPLIDVNRNIADGLAMQAPSSAAQEMAASTV